MPVATVLKNKFSQRKIMLIAASVGIPLLIAIIIMTFFLIQGTATEANEEAPMNINASATDAQNAQVSFQTGKETIAVVEYGMSPDSMTEVSFGNLEATDHSFSIAGLQPNTTYYFRIRSGENVYDDGGSPWTFTTPAGEGTEVDPDNPFPSLEVGSDSANLSPTKTATSSPSIVPTPILSASPSGSVTYYPTPEATPSGTTLPITTTPVSSCQATTDCTSILKTLGTQCTTQDYVKCLIGANLSPTSAVSVSPTVTPVSAETKNACKMSYLQPNSCSSWIWNDVLTQSQTCEDTYTKYFVQCKSTSWDSNDPATWYCNETMTTNQLSLPCATAPSPAPGQSVFCRVRAETDNGGTESATDWIYSASACPQITGDDPECNIDYVQGNSCTSWIWDFDYQKDPRCSDKFDHYFLQCTDDGAFNSTSFWYCNTTTTDHYQDLPCYNAAIPGDGMPITCRVRAEDGYGETSHVSSWSTGSSVCPTSTPTPTYTPTPTNTPTSTPTP